MHLFIVAMAAGVPLAMLLFAVCYLLWAGWHPATSRMNVVRAEDFTD